MWSINQSEASIYLVKFEDVESKLENHRVGLTSELLEDLILYICITIIEIFGGFFEQFEVVENSPGDSSSLANSEVWR